MFLTIAQATINQASIPDPTCLQHFLTKHFTIHFLFFILVNLNCLFQCSNFFLNTIVIGLEFLDHQQIFQCEIKILFPILCLTSPVPGLGDPVRSVVQLLLTIYDQSSS